MLHHHHGEIKYSPPIVVLARMRERPYTCTLCKWRLGTTSSLPLEKRILSAKIYGFDLHILTIISFPHEAFSGRLASDAISMQIGGFQVALRDSYSCFYGMMIS